MASLKLLNLLKMNDWNIRKFLSVILSVQIAVVGLIFLDYIGFQIPLLRELITIFYLLFVPGILILRILKLHNLSSIETILYTLGTSIAFLMFLGFFMNMVYPLLGIKDPLSLFYLLITMSMLVMILLILSYLRDRDFTDTNYITFSNNGTLPIFLYLCTLPFLSIIGTYLMNYYDFNLILMVLLTLIAITVVLIAFNKIPKTLYPLTVFVIAISLLFHTSLISNYIWGWDIQREYFLSNLVFNNSYWDPHLSYEINAMLSITILAPVISKIVNMNLIWVFKIVYPFTFALVPLGLYEVFKKQTNEKIAFLSVFFFMSIFTFWREMVQLARQEIAELFFVLVIMLVVDSHNNKVEKSILLVIFALSMIVSHYGLSYIFMFSIIAAYLLLVLIRRPFFRGFMKRLRFNIKENYYIPNLKNKELTLTFVFLFVIFALSWYMYVSSSFLLERILDLGYHIFNSISVDLLNPEAAQGLDVINATISSPLHLIPKYINLIFQFLIIVGFLSLIKSQWKFRIEYILLSAISLIILFLSIILPYFASALNMTRVYHITLFFLAPFAIIGAIFIFKMFYIVIRRKFTNRHVDNVLKVLSVLLTIQFLFFTGFIYEISNDSNPTSISLSNVDYPIFNTEEIVGAKWLSQENNGGLIYGDYFRRIIFSGITLKETKDIPENFWIPKGSYIYTGKFNTVTNELLIKVKEKANVESFNVIMDILINNKNEIYNNGYSQIFYSS